MSSKVFKTPIPSESELQVVALIDELREDMRSRLVEPRRWAGGLRRLADARAVRASNSIEGYNASLSDVVAAADGERLLEADEATSHAVLGYQEAMTYVLQISQDPDALIDEGLLKSLHFMMIKQDLTKHPGRWRPGAVYVRDEATGETVYEGPPHDQVPALIQATLSELETTASFPTVVRAAMAHLNLVLVHPFSDGNGRMARCLQTLVLARDQIVAPTFSSIEEYLGLNTPDYYAILAGVGQGSWHPENDARPWIKFCLTAHYRQARKQLRRIREYERLWLAASSLAEQHKLPERCIGALSEAALGLRVRRATYRANLEITWGEVVPDQTASRDLRAIVNAGLFKPIGDTRGRYYIAAERLAAEWAEIESQRSEEEQDDPFVLVAGGVQEELDLTASSA